MCAKCANNCSTLYLVLTICQALSLIFYFQLVFFIFCCMSFKPQGILCDGCFLYFFLLAWGGFSHNIVNRRKAWLKFFLWLHQSHVVKMSSWPVSNVPSYSCELGAMGLAQERHSVRWRPVPPLRKLTDLWPCHCLLFQRGSVASLPAQGLSCLLALALKCEHCWWCTSQMEVIAFEVVRLDAQEQSNCINSPVLVEKAEEGTRLHWADAKKTEQQ